MSDPVTCAVLLCPSAEQSRSLRSVCFFDFPHPNDPRYPVWIERTLRSEDWTPSSSSKICSKHFRSTDIIALPHADDSKRTEKRLKYDALPCVFEGIPDSMRPPADVVPRADSPEIILAGQIGKQFVNQGISDSMRPPTDVVPRPDSPEIVPTTNCSKKRSADCMDDNICDETQKESSDLLNASTEVAEAPTNAHLNVSLTDPAILSNNSTGANAPGPVFSAAAVSGAKRTRLLPPPVVCAPKTIPIRPPCSLARKFVDGRLTGVQHCSQHIPVDYPAPTGADEALRCCVPGCLNRRDNNPQGRIYFHAFPTDKRFQTEWIKRVAFSSFWQPAAHSVVCSVHFLSSDYGFIGSILCLKPTAIPSRLGCRNGLMRKLNGPCPFSRVCAICGCWRAIKQDSYYKSASRMAFIPFPEEPSERQKWLTACNGVSCEGQLYACERHFVLADILARFEQDREVKFELQRRDDILPHPSFPVFIPFPLEKRAPTMSGSTQVAIGPLSSPTNSSNSSKNPLNGAVLQNPTVANTPFSLVIRSAKHSTSPEGYRILLMPKQIALPAVASPTALPPVGPSREAFVRTNPSIPMKPSQLPTCSECGMRFGADILCRIHEYEHGNMAVSDDLISTTACAACAAKFDSFAALVQHVKIHGRQTEECPVCQRRFYALKDHIRRHHPSQVNAACCVPGCRIVRQESSQTAKVLFFPFVGATDPRYKTWTQRLRYNSSWAPDFDERICSDHFHQSEIESDKNGSRLTRTALPSQLSCVTSLSGFTAADMASGAVGCAVCGLRPPGDRLPKASEKLQFFRAPRAESETLRQKWVEFCSQQRSDIDWTSIGADMPWYLCENHFEEKYKNDVEGLGSVGEAVPSLTYSLDVNYTDPKLTASHSLMREGIFCCVPGCEAALEKGYSVVGKFFCFLPPADERYDEWLRMVRYNSSWNPEGRTRICREHFPASVIKHRMRDSKPAVRLLRSAFPTQLSCMESLCTFTPADMIAGKQGCAVCGLRPFEPNRRLKASEKLEFFRAPSGEIKEKWIDFCKSQRNDIDWISIPEETPWFLCENHFDAQNKAKYAAQKAIPSLPFFKYASARDLESNPGKKEEIKRRQSVCCVPGCRKFPWDETPPAVFGYFKWSKVNRNEWTNRIRCSLSWSPKKSDHVCSRHFCPEDLCSTTSDQSVKAPRLRVNAMPSQLDCTEQYRAPKNADTLVGREAVQTCCVCGCWRPLDETCLIPSERLSFFPFPDDDILRNSWITACRQWNPSLTVSNECVICENHFMMDNLTRLLEDDSETGLVPKSDAIPTERTFAELPVRLNKRGTAVRSNNSKPRERYSANKCCVPGCGNRAQFEGKKEKITFHMFPSLGTSPRFCEWLNRIRCAISWKPDRHSRVCSKHFCSQDFMEETLKGKQPRTNLLKRDAVPSLLQCVEKFRSPMDLSEPVEVSAVRSCCVCGWWRSAHKKLVRSEVLTLFPFPSDGEQRERWVNMCREWNPDFELSDGSLVCENHFQLDELSWVVENKSNMELKLRSDAVPSERCLRTMNAADNPSTRGHTADVLAGLPVDDLSGLPSFDPDADTVREDESEVGSGAGVCEERDVVLVEESAWDFDAREGEGSLMEVEDADAPLMDITNSVWTSPTPLRTSRADENGLPKVGTLYDMSLALSVTTEDSVEIAPPSPQRCAPDDVLMYCDCCHKFLPTPCWLHAASVCDEPVIPLSVGSLPKMLYLDVCDDSLTGKAVFAKEVIVRHTVFGPLIAPLMPGNSEKALYICITEEHRKYYELESDYACNWMKHVRFADNLQNSNLLVFSRGSQVVFVTIKTVSPHEELKVWYSKQYLDMVDTPVNAAVVDFQLKMEDEVKGTFLPSDDYAEVADAVPRNSKVTGSSPVEAVCVSHLPMESGSSLPVTVDADYRQTDEGFRVRSKPRRTRKTENFYTSNICSECNMRFRKEDMLRLHQFSHTGYDEQPERECPECSKHFDGFPALLKHVDEHGTPLVQCPVCNDTCSLGVILVHLRRYHPGVERGKLYEKRLNCDKCGMRFSYNFLYRLHQLGHQDKECVDSIKISRKCPECGDMFENLEELAEHVDVHGKLMKKCPVCNGYYPGMEKHIARDHPQYLAETRCPECGKECANESSLLHHLQGHQMRASLDSLTCDECRLQFAKDSLYVLHKSSHETPACHAISGAQKCPECDEECDGMGALLEHVVKHAVAAQKCPECYHWFPRHRLRFHIKRHKSAHHSVLQEKESVKRPNLAALTCADCGLRFSTVELVHLHKNKHLEDKISVSTRQCPECSRSFAVADDLVKHVEEHATITRKCPVCGVWRAQMSQHLAQKHPGYKDETQYKCPQCNQRFRLRRRLEEHMLRHGQQGRFRKTTCTQCGLRFSTKLLCRIHEYEHGDKELSDDLPNQTTCAECAEELEGFDALVKHVRIHGRQTEECPVCMGRFHALNEHIRYHHPGCQYRVRKNYTFSTEDNSYRCGECGKEFKSGVGLTAHVNSHVTKALLTARTCSDCGLRFKTDIGCRLHTVRHGNVELTETMRDTRRCPECRRNFERLEELLDHISNHGRSTEKCPVCGDWYAALTVHIRRDHPDFLPKNAITPRKSTSDGLNADDAIDDVCKCPDCGKEFNSRTSFNKHVVNHRTTDKLKTLTCSECGLRFTSDVLCRLHEVCHGKVEVSEAARATRDCPECDKVFAELNELVEHVALHGRHTDKCPVCGQWYASLKEHIRRDHNEHFAEFVAQEKLNCATSKSKERGGYRCGKCGKELPTRNSYDLHMKSHRLKEMKYGHLTCSDCGLRFGSESLCNLHRMQHADKDNLTDRQVDVDDCPQCGESFQEVKELVEHVALHGRRTDKCPVCGQWYAALKEHIRRDHNEHYTEFVAQEKSTSDTPKTKKHGEYRCEKCGKLLPTRTSYDFHTKAHRSNEVTYNSVTCNDCGLRFRSGLLCQLHKLQHASDGCSNEELKNTKSCPECEEEFQGVALLGAHVAVHGKATSKCPVCSRWYGALRFHVRREHPEHFLKYTAQLNANRVQVPAKAVSDESKRKETPRKGYRCPKCSKSIENFSAFTCHMQQSHGVEEPAGIGTCDMCGLRFLSEQLCELHKVQHGLFSKNLQCTGKCPECGGKFQQLQALADHVATHGVQTEKCYVCNKWFASLRQHAPRCFSRAVVRDRSELPPLVDSLTKASSPRKTGHSKRYFKCRECIKEFRSRDFLQAHMKADHAAPKCVVCDEVLGSVDDRHQHMLTHSTTNDLKCGICKKTFQSSRSFAAHVKKHANGKLCEPIAEEFAPDECVVCRKSFADFLQLNQHVKKHNLHGGFECAMCAERFPFYYLLSRHVMEKQHWRPKIGIPCSVCHEELPNENALQLHLFTHHDAELTVKCCWCAERFTCNDDLDVHIAAVHAPADGEDYGMEEVAVDDELFGNVGGN